MKSCAIVIIDYKPSLSVYERISLEQCSLVLSHLDLFLVSFRGNDLTAHKRAIQRDERIFTVEFPKYYFKSIHRYNRLLTSKRFYESFKGYEYILIHHTDSFVFKNEIDYWCQKGYDYIGAPLYKYDGTMSPPAEDFICVGNGGFSLHKVSTALRVLSTFRRIYPIKTLLNWYGGYSLSGKIYYLPYFLLILCGLGGNSYYRLNYLRVNEDIFWGKHVAEAFPDFHVAPLEEASKFSMEYNCELLLKRNGGKIPFGCHGWFKQGFLDFWMYAIRQHKVAPTPLPPDRS